MLKCVVHPKKLRLEGMIFSYRWNLRLCKGEISKREVTYGIVVKLDYLILVLLLPF